MKQFNDKIRNGIANSYHLRELAKDGRLTQEQRDKAYEQAHEIDKKIIFYKQLKNAMMKQDTENKHFK